MPFPGDLRADAPDRHMAAGWGGVASGLCVALVMRDGLAQ